MTVIKVAVTARSGLQKIVDWADLQHLWVSPQRHCSVSGLIVVFSGLTVVFLVCLTVVFLVWPEIDCSTSGLIVVLWSHCSVSVSPEIYCSEVFQVWPEIHCRVVFLSRQRYIVV